MKEQTQEHKTSLLTVHQSIKKRFQFSIIIHMERDSKNETVGNGQKEKERGLERL